VAHDLEFANPNEIFIFNAFLIMEDGPCP